MKRPRLSALIAIIGAVTALLAGAGPASATARPKPLPAARAMSAVQVGGGPAAPLPAGVRPARPPRPGTHLAGRLRAGINYPPGGCYYQQTLISVVNADYVSAELGYTGANYAMLRARATSAGPWEKFDICYNAAQGYWYFVSDANGLAVSAELGYTGANYAMLRARATAIGPWEHFTLGCVNGPPVSPPVQFIIILSQANLSYVSTEVGYTGGNYAMLRARSQSITYSEEYFDPAIC